MLEKLSTVAEIDIKQRLQQIGLTFPRELTLTITSRCNLRCRHCWPESGPDVVNAHVPFESLSHVIQQWHDAGLRQICITGGEPLVHPQWQEILSDCCSKPGIKEVRLQTNGTLFSSKVVDLLTRSGYHKVTLHISLDGCGPEGHDTIRGKGSFVKTLAALQLLHQAGLSHRTTIYFTETAENFDQLPQALRLVDDFNFSCLISNTLISGGRAANDSNLHMPTPEQYLELIQLYEHDQEFRKLYNRRGNIAAIEWYRHRDIRGASDTCSCMATPYINAQGQLYPCTLLPIPWLAIDNVWTKSFLHLMDEIEQKWAQLHNLSQKRPEWISKCQSCSGRDHCQGGCLGRSLSTMSDFLQPEDRCLHRRAVYNWGKVLQIELCH